METFRGELEMGRYPPLSATTDGALDRKKLLDFHKVLKQIVLLFSVLRLFQNRCKIIGRTKLLVAILCKYLRINVDFVVVL